MNVLQLVPTVGPFMEEQVRAVETDDISCTVLEVPKAGEGQRSVRDYASYYGRVLTTIRNGEFDFVHANYGLTAPMALAQPVRPVVLSLWGSDVFGTYSYVSKVCAKGADEVIVMSQEMADAIGGNPDIIPHGVNLEWFQPRPQQEAQAKVGWDSDSHHVLFPWGKDRPVKDYPRAERVVDAARDQISDRVELHSISGVLHEEMPTYMNAADVLIMTSKWEGSPNSVREALACNLPVVAADVGDVSEHVCDLELSQVCHSDRELVDALVRVLQSEHQPDGRSAVQDHSLGQMREDILDVYSRALS